MGSDPPYSPTVSAAGLHACGHHASWLLEYVRTAVIEAASADGGGVICDGNVCCISGMEYVPTRGIALRPVSTEGGRVWVLDATWEVAEASLPEGGVRANRRYVAGELARLGSRRCPGEPAGWP